MKPAAGRRHQHRTERHLPARGKTGDALGSLLRGRRCIFGQLHDKQHAIGNAEQTGGNKAQPPVTDGEQQSDDQRRRRHPHIAEHAIDAEAKTDAAVALDQHGNANRMIDRRKHADQADCRAKLPDRLGHAGDDRGDADAEMIDHHHQGP